VSSETVSRVGPSGAAPQADGGGSGQAPLRRMDLDMKLHDGVVNLRSKSVLEIMDDINLSVKVGI